ncbi:hypothetical protein K1719_023749 [Acacia pycnantha]|nr:hypothetical protein K1719_023749 [Acacia pycnantha]
MSNVNVMRIISKVLCWPSLATIFKIVAGHGSQHGCVLVISLEENIAQSHCGQHSEHSPTPCVFNPFISTDPSFSVIIGF